MSEYVLVEDQGADTAALYNAKTGELLEARHVEDVRESLLVRLEKAGVIDYYTGPTMPSTKYKWEDTYQTLEAFKHLSGTDQ